MRSCVRGCFTTAFFSTLVADAKWGGDPTLTEIEDVIAGHDDLYIASDLPYRTDFGYIWVGVLSRGGASLENAHFAWDGLFLGWDAPTDRSLVHGVSLPTDTGLISVNVTLATSETVSLESQLPTMFGCWMGTVFWEADAGVDEFGEEWPSLLIGWQPSTTSITFAVNQHLCASIPVAGGSNPCEVFKGTLSEAAPTAACGMPSTYQSDKIYIMQYGDEIVYHFAEGRTRRLHRH